MKCAGAGERPIVRKHFFAPHQCLLNLRDCSSFSQLLVQEKRLVSSLWIQCGGLGPLIAAYDKFIKGAFLNRDSFWRVIFGIFKADLAYLPSCGRRALLRHAGASDVMSMN